MGQIRAVRPERLADLVAKQFEQSILAGVYLPGTQLPPERELAKQIGVSRPVLRESLRALEMRGLLVTYHGRGTYVAQLPDETISPIEWLRENNDGVRRFYEFRQLVEPPAAAWAAQRASDQEIADLKRNLDEAAGHSERGEILPFVALDIEFHQLIAHMSGNPFLYQALERIVNPESDFRRVILRLPDHLPVAHRRHVAIYEAIAARDSQLASTHMYAALAGAVRAVEEWLAK